MKKEDHERLSAVFSACMDKTMKALKLYHPPGVLAACMFVVVNDPDAPVGAKNITIVGDGVGFENREHMMETLLAVVATKATNADESVREFNLRNGNN